MEAKSQAPIQRLMQLETMIQQLNHRWNGLGERIEDALEDISGYRMINHDLQFATDKNTELRCRNAALANRFANYKCQMENVVGSMRMEIEKLKIENGCSTWSAGFQSHLITGNMKNLGQFIAPDMTPDKSSPIIAQSSPEGRQLSTNDVIRGFQLSHVPPEDMLEHLNPTLAQEKEEQETQELMPLVKEELQTINWSGFING